MIDTSVMVAGLVDSHGFHQLAWPHTVRAARGRGPGIVATESWAALRRYPWHLGADVVEQLLGPWASSDRIAITPVDAYQYVLRNGRTLHLGGRFHDLLIALICAAPLVALDRQQAALARGLPDPAVILLDPAG